MDSIFTKWERLLQLVIEHHPPFLAVLAEEMVNELAFSSIPDPKSSPFCEGLYLWLDHMLTSTQWQPSRRLLSFAYILAVCDGISNQWTSVLGERLRNVDRGSVGPGVSQGERPRLDIPPMTEDSAEMRKYGWELPDRWDSRPIGVAQQTWHQYIDP